MSSPDRTQEARERAERIAQAFHEAYERLAPQFGYETREASAVPWDDVPEPNKSLMVAVADEVLADRVAALETALREIADAVEPKLSTMNHYFGPGSRTAVSRDSEAQYLRISQAVRDARAALAEGDNRP